MITMSREEFATKRFDRQEQAIETLTPIVSKALDNYAQEDWWRTLLAPARLLFNDVLREDSGGEVRHDVRAWATLSKQLRDALPRTGKPDEYTAKVIATWISTAAINWAAITAAGHDSEPLIMEWVTMHDSKVRTAHKDTDGQQRPVGEMFDVDGFPMIMPGDTRAPIELWINCRCAVRPAVDSLAAAAVEGDAAPKEGRVIVALPAADDPVNDLAPDEAHLTLVWLGKPDENADLDMDLIRASAEAFAHLTESFTATVDRVEPLGDDGAIVWMLSEKVPTLVHDRLLADENIRAAHEAVKQYPHFTPHNTIGYDLMLSGDGIDALSEVESITYDRLAVWDGDQRAEYPFGGAMTEVASAAEVADAPVVEVEPGTPLAWHGILAPEGVWSGDGRQFAPDSLRFRDLPLPLTWQKASGVGHDGSVTIAKIEFIERVGNMMRAGGTFVDTPETDEAVGLIAEFGKFGVSVDADDAAFEFDEETEKVTFTSARIASASMVAIPAFAEAFIALGTWADAEGAPGMPPSEVVDSECDPNSPDYEDCVARKRESEVAALDAYFYDPVDYTHDSGLDAGAEDERVLALAGRAELGRVRDAGSAPADGAPAGVRGTGRADPGRAHAGSPVSEPAVLPTGSPGTVHDGGQLSSRTGHDDGGVAGRHLHEGAPDRGGESGAANGQPRDRAAALSDLRARQVAGGVQAAEGTDGTGPATFVSDTPWSQFTQADYTDAQWYSACVLHKNGTSKAKGDNGLPIKEPGGALNRNGVHAAAGRFNQVDAPPEAKAAAARALRGAYATLGEDPPDAIKAVSVTDSFGRGPGWITNPEDTKRLHDYWTKPGHEGYTKVGWGTPGDFQRCRTQVGEEIAENSPDTTRFLNQICAQWHHDATGFWPGDAPAERVATSGSPSRPALSLVASVPYAPADWFTDPHFDALTPITVTEEGRVFGHLCGWETCHTGFDGICVAPPPNSSGYAYFLTGEVLTTDGPVAVGQVTVGGGHAAAGLRMRPAMAHYDSTSAAVADVTCGDDEHGIWMAGWVRPGATDEQVYALRAAAPSGDWRQVGGSMELIAAHSVNSQGFPVPRVGVGVKNGAQVSLVAAGVVAEQATGETAFDVEEFADKVAAAIEARTARREKMATLMARVGGQ